MRAVHVMKTRGREFGGQLHVFLTQAVRMAVFVSTYIVLPGGWRGWEGFPLPVEKKAGGGL